MSPENFYAQLLQLISEQNSEFRSFTEVAARQEEVLKQILAQNSERDTSLKSLRVDHEAHKKVTVTWPHLGRIILGVGTACSVLMGVAAVVRFFLT